MTWVLSYRGLGKSSGRTNAAAIASPNASPLRTAASTPVASSGDVVVEEIRIESETGLGSGVLGIVGRRDCRFTCGAQNSHPLW